MILYRAHLLDTPVFGELRSVPDGAVLVDGAGRIASTGPYSEFASRSDARVVDLRPHWILPGLVDLHVHLPQYEAVAMDGLELLPWLETHIFPAEARFADVEVARAAARVFFQDLLRLGTTTAAAYATVHAPATHAAFEEAEAAGLRCVMGKVMMDLRAPDFLREDTADSLRESEALIRRWHGAAGGRLHYALTPRFVPTCSAELMRGAGELSRAYGCYVQTHLSESVEEVALVKLLFPEADHYTDVYRRHGLLHERTLLAHGIYLGEGEVAMIQEAGAAVVHCPTSNAFLRSGVMPARQWLGAGLTVGLGTDVGAGTSLSLWAEAAMACTASKLRWVLLGGGDDPLAPREAFHLATQGGALALGWGDRVGSLDPGKEADFLVVDVRKPDPAGRSEDLPDRVLSRLLYRSDPAMVVATFVQGRQCHGTLPEA